MKKQIFSIVLAVLMVVSMVPMGVFTASAATYPSILYLNRTWDSTKKVVVTPATLTDTPYGAKFVQIDDFFVDTLKNGVWYYVSSTVTTYGRLKVAAGATTNLVLYDDCSLTVDGGIYLPSNSTLNIYSQSKDNGKLILLANASTESMAGIGGDSGEAGGTVNMRGGVLEAHGGTGAAGIGGGQNGNGGKFTMYGGTVKAYAGTGAQAIGAGKGKSTQGTITLYATVDTTGATTGTSVTLTPHTHKYTASYAANSDGTTHSGVCSCGAKSTDKKNHSYIQGVCVCSAIDPVVISGQYVRRDWEKEHQRVVDEPQTIPKAAIPITNSTTHLSDNRYYVVDGNVTSTARVTVGDNTGKVVRVILKDGAKWTAPYGVEVQGDNNLVIYGQNGDTGSLEVKGQSSNSTYQYDAGIGGSKGQPGGNITVNGGKIYVQGFKQGAGIGGAYGQSGGTLTVYGGSVEAYGGLYAAGIGGGESGRCGTVNIYGGSVKATSGNDGAGIGTGRNIQDENFIGGKVNVYGGTVDALSVGRGAGIGGGYKSDGCVFKMEGGIVKAQAGSSADAIGVGADYDLTNIKLKLGENRLPDDVQIGDDLGYFKAGPNSSSLQDVTVDEYRAARQQYVEIHVHRFNGEVMDNGDGTHGFKCAECDKGSNLGEHFFEDGFCPCGAPEPKELKASMSLIFDSYIGTKVYMNLDEMGATQVVANYNTHNRDYEMIFEDVTMTTAEATSAQVDGKLTLEPDGRYSFVVWQTPGQIAEPVSFVVYDGEGNALSETKTINAKYYADRYMGYGRDLTPEIEEETGVTDKQEHYKRYDYLKALVIYGDYAKNYFEYKVDQYPIISTEADRANYAATGNYSLDNFRQVGSAHPTKVTGSIAGLTPKGMSFMVLSGSNLRIYFDGDLSDVNVSVMTYPWDWEDGGYAPTVIKNTEKGYVEFAVRGYEAGFESRITLTKGGQTMVISTCPNSYLQLAQSTDGENDMYAAIAQYFYYAYEYIRREIAV